MGCALLVRQEEIHSYHDIRSVCQHGFNSSHDCFLEEHSEPIMKSRIVESAVMIKIDSGDYKIQYVMYSKRQNIRRKRK